MHVRLLVEPERYLLYSCPEIATASQANIARQHELEGADGKGRQRAGGQIASGMAYAPEYYQLRGEMVQLRKAAADKNCSAAPGGPAPGAGLPGSRTAPSR